MPRILEGLGASIEQALGDVNVPAYVIDVGTEARVQVSSVPLHAGHKVVGVFGLLSRPPEPRAEPRYPHPTLTPREVEVLRLLAGGASTDQIAELLNISRETVRNHVRSILRKLGVHSRLEAIAVARGEGMLDD
jgi:DNA-binding CsgD family transcriptional regulator